MSALPISIVVPTFDRPDQLRRTLPSVLGHAERQGLRIAELRTHSATLEDVFVSLTGRHLRDA